MRLHLLSVLPLAALIACAPAEERDAASPPQAGGEAGSPAAGTRPAGEPRLITVEGRIGEGVECPTIETPDGLIYTFSQGEADFGQGDYVRIVGEIADASLCMQGQGHLIPQEIEEIEPPAADRDPARAGGVRLTRDYLLGSWTAEGGDCTRPDFQITGNAAGGQVIETSLEGSPRTGYVRLGPDPAFVFDQPRRDLALESRGPDGVAVMPPEDGPVSLAGRRIAGDGVVFIKCAD